MPVPRLRFVPLAAQTPGGVIGKTSIGRVASKTGAAVLLTGRLWDEVKKDEKKSVLSDLELEDAFLRVKRVTTLLGDESNLELSPAPTCSPMNS